MFTINVNRIRSARIKNTLDNCLATNKIGQMIPKEDLREEVEWYVDTYPGFPKRSIRTGEYLYPLGPDPIDAPKPDAALVDFRNVDHAETWGVPNSTKKHGESFHSLSGVRVDERILRHAVQSRSKRHWQVDCRGAERIHHALSQVALRASGRHLQRASKQIRPTRISKFWKMSPI